MRACPAATVEAISPSLLICDKMRCSRSKREPDETNQNNQCCTLVNHTVNIMCQCCDCLHQVMQVVLGGPAAC
jgi:hypothetical protein